MIPLCLRHLVPALQLVLVWLPAGSLWAEGVSIEDIHTVLRDDNIYVSAKLNFVLTDKVREAVDNGIPVVLVIKMRIDRPREYWFSEEVVRERRRYELRYHALAERYLVSDLGSGVQQRFRRLEAALEYAGRLLNYHLVDSKELGDPGDYQLRMLGTLDIGSLPTPLRLWAYLDSGWYVKSEWYERPLIGAEQ